MRMQRSLNSEQTLRTTATSQELNTIPLANLFASGSTLVIWPTKRLLIDLIGERVKFN